MSAFLVEAGKEVYGDDDSYDDRFYTLLIVMNK